MTEGMLTFWDQESSPLWWSPKSRGSTCFASQFSGSNSRREASIPTTLPPKECNSWRCFSGQHGTALLWVELWHVFLNASLNWPVHAYVSSVHRKCYAVWLLSRALRACFQELDSHLAGSLLDHRNLPGAEPSWHFRSPSCALCIKTFSYVSDDDDHCWGLSLWRSSGPRVSLAGDEDQVKFGRCND